MPLARQKSWLTWVKWPPVSNKAVTGCPLIKICSSLALPSSCVHIASWFCSFFSTKSSVPFPLVADLFPVLALALGCSFGECLLSPLGMLKHSPLETALCLLKWGNPSLNVPLPHAASIGLACRI